MENAARYSAVDSGFGGIQGHLAQIRNRLAEYRRYRATLGELEALSDRELADLGLSRTDIRAIARQSVWGN